MSICGVVCNCGPEGEPLACGYPIGHEGNHAWSAIPSFCYGEHKWVGHKNPNTSDGPGEYVEYCDNCGSERPDSD